MTSKEVKGLFLGACKFGNLVPKLLYGSNKCTCAAAIHCNYVL